MADLLVNTIDLAFHPNLTGAAGELAVDCLHDATAGDFILVVDGGIPTAFDGHTCILGSEKDGREVTTKEAVFSWRPRPPPCCPSGPAPASAGFRAETPF